MGCARRRLLCRDDERARGTPRAARSRSAVLDARRRTRGAGARRDGQDALQDAGRPSRRGGADALPRRPRSLCLSSQSGCPLTCTFCATGQMAFGRNLSASEILDQALHFRRIEAVDHAVFMGMGEPMLNLDAVVDAARLLADVGITNRRATVSTVGW